MSPNMRSKVTATDCTHIHIAMGDFYLLNNIEIHTEMI